MPAPMLSNAPLPLYCLGRFKRLSLWHKQSGRKLGCKIDQHVQVTPGAAGLQHEVLTALVRIPVLKDELCRSRRLSLAPLGQASRSNQQLHKRSM